MKKIIILLFIYSFVFSLNSLAQETKEIPFVQLSFINSTFNETQNIVTFKGGKWDSYIKLPSSINQELSKFNFMVINIPQSTVMIRIKFQGENNLCKYFYQPVVKSEINRRLDLSLVSFISDVKEIKIEAQQSVDEMGNYHTLHINSICLTN